MSLEYTLCTMVSVDGKEFECHLTFQSHCQFRPGDVLHFPEFGEWSIKEVVWYVEKDESVATAFMTLEEVDFEGVSWLDTIDDIFDYRVPDE